MDSINEVNIMGYLGDDPKAFGPCCGLTVATTDRFKPKDCDEYQERTQWHRVKVFGRAGDACVSILRKGSPVHVSGRIEYSSYEKDGVKKYTTEIIARKVIFLPSGKPKNDEVFGGPPMASSPNNVPAFASDDDIPF
jgi:single-strand DNA-binding protein